MLRSQSKGGHPYPWHDFLHTETRKLECTVRVNEWELSVLHYVAGRQRKSLSKLMLEYAREAALKQVIEWEGQGGQ